MSSAAVVVTVKNFFFGRFGGSSVQTWAVVLSCLLSSKRRYHHKLFNIVGVVSPVDFCICHDGLLQVQMLCTRAISAVPVVADWKNMAPLNNSQTAETKQWKKRIFPKNGGCLHQQQLSKTVGVISMTRDRRGDDQKHYTVSTRTRKKGGDYKNGKVQNPKLTKNKKKKNIWGSLLYSFFIFIFCWRRQVRKKGSSEHVKK